MRKPHVCPKCNGYGSEGIEQHSIGRFDVHMKELPPPGCPVCNNTGVVWDPETDFVQDRPPPTPLPDVEEKKDLTVEDYIPDGDVDSEQRVEQMNAKTDYEAEKDGSY